MATKRRAKFTWMGQVQKLGESVRMIIARVSALETASVGREWQIWREETDKRLLVDIERKLGEVDEWLRRLGVRQTSVEADVETAFGAWKAWREETDKRLRGADTRLSQVEEDRADKLDPPPPKISDPAEDQHSSGATVLFTEDGNWLVSVKGGTVRWKPIRLD